MTALETGKTILVRVERRGPMTGKALVELSPGAAAQLGVVGVPRAAIRVRRVNPVEQDRALLRMSQPAPARMDTPKSLLTVLGRKFDQQEGIVRQLPLPTPVTEPTPPPALTPVKVKPAKPVRPVKPLPKPGATPLPKPAPVPAPALTPKPAAAATHGRYAVQVGAFSSRANAQAAASKIGGSVSPAGKFWRVRMGPFASEAEGKAALAKAKVAGYSDARIQRAD